MQVPPHFLHDEQLAHDDAEDEEHAVPLTGETFKEFVESNEFVMVNFVSFPRAREAGGSTRARCAIATRVG